MAGRKARSRHSRSTRGCRVCRSRHLKCDEDFPCGHCLSAGWPCDGPRSTTDLVFQAERPDIVRSSDAKLQRDPSPFVWLTNSQEKRAFEFYLRRARPLLSGALDWEFWGCLVPCLAESDVTVRYIMLAISHFCEHPIRSSEQGKIQVHPLSSRHVVALQWQARALSLDRQWDGKTEIWGLILKYVLLSAHEFQQNNYRSGWRLLRVAYSLVSPLITSGCDSTDDLSASSYMVMKVLIPCMMRNVCLLFNPWGRSSLHILHLTSFEDLEAELYNHLCAVYACVKTAFLAIRSQACVENDRLVAKQEELRSDLSMLRNKTLTVPENGDQAHLVKRRALHQYCDIAVYWLDVVAALVRNSPKEPHFLHTLLTATQKLSAIAATFFSAAANTTFFHSFAIYPTAYFVTIFSRDPQLKSEALMLLNERTHHDSIPHLLALVRKTEECTKHYAGDIDVNSVFQIHHGDKDRELHVDEVYDGPIQ